MLSVCVMAVGNVLMGDDALGPRVLCSLDAALEFPPQVTLLDAGTPGLDLTLLIDGVDALIVIDAIKAAGAPGEVRAYRRDEMLRGALPVVMSPHEPTLREALLRLELFGRGPSEVLLVGAIPQRVTAGTGLSPAVRATLPVIEEQVLRELSRLGVPGWPRAEPRPLDIWWEAPAEATTRRTSCV